MEQIKVVVHYRAGKIMKGYTHDFFPHKDRFHLFPVDRPNTQGTEVFLKDLKAIFLVRDFAGDPNYVDRKKYVEGEKPSGKKVEVLFEDTEVLVGSTLGYDRSRPGFFILPVDPKSNNLRVFVVSSAVKQVRQLD